MIVDLFAGLSSKIDQISEVWHQQDHVPSFLKGKNCFANFQSLVVVISQNTHETFYTSLEVHSIFAGLSLQQKLPSHLTSHPSTIVLYREIVTTSGVCLRDAKDGEASIL